MDLAKIVKKARENPQDVPQEDGQEPVLELAQNRQAPSAPTYKQKWFRKRYQLFSKFDLGIRVSETMWFSVTPEQVAKTVAISLIHTFPGAKTVVDVCGGAGGNTIAFSRQRLKTVYVDIDPQVAKDAEHNAGIYGCENIDFVVSDFADLDLTLHADPESTVVHVSPEWGGPGYKNVEVFDLDTCVPTCETIVNQCKAQGFDKLMLYLPKNSDLQQLSNLGCTRVDNINIEGRQLALLAYWIDATSLERARAATEAKTEKLVKKQADKEAQQAAQQAAKEAAAVKKAHKEAQAQAKAEAEARRAAEAEAQGKNPTTQETLREAKKAAKKAKKEAKKASKKEEKEAEEEDKSRKIEEMELVMKKLDAGAPKLDGKRKNSVQDANPEKRARSELPAAVPSEPRNEYDLTWN